MFDPAIKLFGKTIPLPETLIPPALNEQQDACGETTKSEVGDSFEEEPCKLDKSSALDNGKRENDQTPIQEIKAIVDAETEKETLTTDCDGQEKVLKKPDKIIPCPRCNSMDTKFCYYNNYNVNQPRHFCKNCQRYWTAGGTMRNVPVGAGRRKNKHIASQYRHIMMSSGGTSITPSDTVDSTNHKVNLCGGLSASLGTCNGNGSVLSDAPLCKSMAAVLNIGDRKRKTEMEGPVCGENGQEPSSCGSSVTVSVSKCGKMELPNNVTPTEQHGMTVYCDVPAPPLQNPLPCYPSPPWAYPWNSGWNNVAAMVAGHCPSEMFYRMDSGDLKQGQWGSTPIVVAPTFCTPSMPFPFVPASYWGCMSNAWAPGAWNMSWNGSDVTQSALSSSCRSSCSSNSSPTLGKHSRDANIRAEGMDDNTEKYLWIPKTLRIDDPDEAAKSSIWATLGINPGKSEPILKGGIFKAFQPKTEVDTNASNATEVLQANPAALSRSQAFQESA